MTEGRGEGVGEKECRRFHLLLLLLLPHEALYSSAAEKKAHVETQTHMSTSIKLQVHVRAYMPMGVRSRAHRKEEGHESCINTNL